MATDMTETEWLECGPEGPAPMIEFLRETHLNDRKLFLAGCAWARRFWVRQRPEREVPLGRRSRTAIEVYERLADGTTPLGDYDAAWSRFKEKFDKDGDYFAFNDVNESEMDFYTALIQARAAWRRTLPYVEEAPSTERDLVLPARGVYSVGRGALIDASDEFALASDDLAAEYQAQCDIIRDIFGNPFQPVGLDFANGDEGVDLVNDKILSHFKSQPLHVRGCWVIDRLSGNDRLKFPLQLPLLIPADLTETADEFQANYERAARDNQLVGQMLKEVFEKLSDGTNTGDSVEDRSLNGPND